MAYLLLDLDETAILYLGEGVASPVHPSHELSEHYINAELGEFCVSVRIINPEKLARLIEVAYESDGVVIMTAGFWCSLIKTEIADYLMKHFNLNPDVGEKFKDCLFLSPSTEAMSRQLRTSEIVYPELIRTTPKAHRFNWMMSEYSDFFSKKYFTFLDDNVFHINSFSGYSNVTTVWAQTKDLFIDFYQQAAQSLRLQHCHEMELAKFLESYKSNGLFFDKNFPIYDDASVCSNTSMEPFAVGEDDQSIGGLDSSSDSIGSVESVNSTGSMIRYAIN